MKIVRTLCNSFVTTTPVIKSLQVVANEGERTIFNESETSYLQYCHNGHLHLPVHIIQCRCSAHSYCTDTLGSVSNRE